MPFPQSYLNQFGAQTAGVAPPLDIGALRQEAARGNPRALAALAQMVAAAGTPPRPATRPAATPLDPIAGLDLDRGAPTAGEPLPLPGIKPPAPDIGAMPTTTGPMGENLAASVPLPIPGRRPAPPGAEPPLMPSRGGAPGPAGRDLNSVIASGSGPAMALAPASPAAPGRGDLYRSLLEFGLATMAAGGQPGATVGSALGAGGLTALQGHDAREQQRIGAEAAARSEARENRTLDLKEQDIFMSAQTRLAELEQRAEDRTLDREQRADLAREANDIKRMMAEASAGNASALRSLQQQAQQDRVDNQAASMYARLINGAQMSSMTGRITPEQVAEIEATVSKAFPGATISQSFGQPAGGGAAQVFEATKATTLPDGQAVEPGDQVTVNPDGTFVVSR